ncbi:MAG: XRE family transcriptional regulator [Clostridia bacterium]|nr:XRE family transcriptional regulator [Clostridia bacterium]MDE7215570.1 XRE family transcriptional regulator [Clostridia bacterium]MDE7337309.1 XRE family transcriptional regulator [Clostridia bacterium]
MDLGIKIKRLRLQCGLTQEELADRCELTKGYISQLENNLTSPSITTLIDILEVLGSDLKSFFNEEVEEKIVFDENDFFEKEDDGELITWLVPNSLKNEMEPILLTLQAGVSTTEDMPHEGEEFGYVLEGTATLHIGKKTYEIAAGNSFYFTSKKKHFIQNDGKGVTKILWVSSPPTF